MNTSDSASKLLPNGRIQHRSVTPFGVLRFVNIRIKIGAEAYGPFNLEQLKEAIETNLLSPTDLCCFDNSETWIPLADIPELVEAILSPPQNASQIDGAEEPNTGVVERYLDSAEKGVAEVQYNLGLCYERGLGVAKSPSEAAKWFRKAAEQGLAQAQTDLGLCCEKGVGVAKDASEAANWSRKAAELGYARAKQNLTRLQETL